MFRLARAGVAMTLVAAACNGETGAPADGDARGARATSSGTDRGALTVERDVVYGKVDGARLTADVYLPAAGGTNRPAVLVIHGGGWTGGDKDSASWAGYGLASLGYVAVAVNYRLAPEDPYPAAVEDVQRAVRWLRRPLQRDAYGIDPTRVGAVGGSAGGHLAVMLGVLGRGALDRGARVAAAVSWSGPLDLTEEAALVDRGRRPRTDLPVFLDCTRNDCPADRAEDASPHTHVDETDAPILLAYAEDDIVPASTARPLVRALEQAGIEHVMLESPGLGHSSSLAPALSGESLLFLDAYLRNGPRDAS